MTTSTPTTSTTPTTLMVVESMARAGKDVLLIELRAANLGTDGSGAATDGNGGWDVFWRGTY